jgi:hypothetical protein
MVFVWLRRAHKTHQTDPGPPFTAVNWQGMHTY